MLRIIFVLAAASLLSFQAFAQGNCETLAQTAAKALAKTNRDAIGKVLNQVHFSQLVYADKLPPNSRANSHETYSIVLTDGDLRLRFTVKTNKDNDEIGDCSVESVEMEPVFY